MNSDDDRGRGFACRGLCVGVEEPGRKDTEVLRDVDGVSEAWERFLGVLREEGKRKGINGELDLVGGEMEGQPEGVSHQERAVELSHECIEVGSKSGSGDGSVGEHEGDRASLIDLCGDCEGEGTVGIPEDACCYVWESGCYQGGLVVPRGGRTRSVEPSFCLPERLGG